MGITLQTKLPPIQQPLLLALNKRGNRSAFLSVVDNFRKLPTADPAGKNDQLLFTPNLPDPNRPGLPGAAATL